MYGVIKRGYELYFGKESGFLLILLDITLYQELRVLMLLLWKFRCNRVNNLISDVKYNLALLRIYHESF